jgi:hypothetical protein
MICCQLIFFMIQTLPVPFVLDTNRFFRYLVSWEKRMPRCSKLTKRFHLGRWIHIATAVFVFSYIAFDVLDLDLSDFPLKQASQERTVIITETPKTVELANALSAESFRIASSVVQPFVSKESIRFQQKHLIQPARFREILIFLHRLNLPQSSSTDSSPAA